MTMESTAETTESSLDTGFSDVHPLDKQPEDDQFSDHTTTAPAVSGRRTRGVGSTRHSTSIVLSLLAVPAGYGFLDYGWPRAEATAALGHDIPQKVMVALGAAAACFLVASLAGRISALGPLLAALVWGAAPTAWVLLDYASYRSRLNDLPELFHGAHTGFGLYSIGFAVFPAVTGLLLGVAVAGRWRRPVAVSPW